MRSKEMRGDLQQITLYGLWTNQSDAFEVEVTQRQHLERDRVRERENRVV